MALKLSFRDNSEHESGFHVYRSDAPMDPRNLPKPYKDLGRNSSVVIDEDFGGIFDQRRYYRVAAYVKGGNRSVSEEAHAGYDGKSPTLNLDFASLQYAVAQGIGLDLSPRAFSDLITFTRSTGGGRFNAQGQYEWLPADQPRIDYDPVTGECRGLLIEEQRTNLLTYSSDFANGVWTKALVTVTGGVQSPDGGSGASRVQTTAVSATSPARAVSDLTVAGATYTYSVWLRADTPLSLSLQVPTPSYGSYLATKSIAVTQAWQRFDITFTGQAGALWIRASATGTVYDIWGAQLEAGSTPSSYIPTTNAQVTRAASDPLLQTLSPWFNQSAGTFIIEHNAVAGRPLLSSGETLLASSAGPGKTVLAYDASGSYVSQNGGEFVAGPPLTFGDSLRLMRSATQWANAHCKALRYYPRRLTLAEASA